MITIGDKWFADQVPDWKNVPISGQSLCMALWGFAPSGCVTITWDNHEEIAKYIHEKTPLKCNETNESLTLDAHIRLMRQCIGFKKVYMG